MSRSTNTTRSISVLTCAMLAVLAALLVPAGNLGAADYHVDQSGDDSTGDGSLGDPWRTIQYGSNQLSPGDTLHVHAGTYPDSGDPQDRIEPHNSGTSGNWVTIRNYQSDEVTISTDEQCFYIEDVEYVILDGFELIGAGTTPTVVSYANNIIIRNCTIRQTSNAVKSNSTSTRYSGLMVENCLMYSFTDIAIFVDNMDGVIIRGNTLYDGSSVLMDPGGISNLVIDGNFAYNTGNRLGELKIRWGNVESQSGDNCNGAIVRRNVFCNGERYIALLASANGAMVYNNTLAKIDGEATESGILFMQQDGTDATDDKNEYNVIKNNNFYNTGDDTVPETWWYNTFIYMDASMSEDYGDQEIDYNSYYKAGGVKYIRYGTTWVEKANVNGWYSGQYDNNSVVGDDPDMDNPTTAAGISGFDLTSSSPCIDAGTALTRTDGSGSGTTITVDDARYFCDGCSLVDGDDIVVGDDTVTVTGRDISQNTITVDSSISWSDGDIVTLVFNGDAPDIGAFESDFDTSNATPTADAGSDDECTLPAGVTLDGTVSDDGLPDPPASLTTTWTKQTGPGTVTFGDSSAVDTTAGFSEAGTYVLRLTADDGGKTDYDDVSITVNAAGLAPFAEEGGTVVMEAENFDTNDTRSDGEGWWLDSTDYAGYVGDGHMEAPERGTETWADAAELTYEIDFSTAGTYYIWVRRWADKKQENTAFVGLDDTQIGGTFDDEEANYDQWYWKEHGTTVYISAAQHTFNLRRREPQYGVDRIILTDDSGYTPSGNGPAESSRE